MAKRKLEGELVVTDKTGPGIASARKGLQEYGNEAERQGKKATEATSASAASFANMAAGIGGAVTAVQAVAGAIGNYVAGLRELIETSAVQIEAELLFDRALQNTGQYSREAAAALKAQASALQDLTTFGDEAILQQSTMALGMGVQADQLAEVQKASADLAAGMRIDLSSAFKIVSQATLGNVAMAGRYVPAVRELTKEQVAQGEALKILGDAFDGFANAQARTLTGALQQLSNSWGDFNEVRGSVVANNPAVVAAVVAVKDQLNGLIAITAANTDEASEFVRSGILFMLDAFKVAVTVIETVVQTFNVLRMAMQGQMVVVAGLAEGFLTAFSQIERAARFAANGFRGNFADIETNLDGVIGLIRDFGETAEDQFSASKDAMLSTRTAAEGIRTAIDGVKQAAASAKAPVEDLAGAIGPASKPDSLAGAATGAAKALEALEVVSLDDIAEQFRSALASAQAFKDAGMLSLSSAMEGTAASALNAYRDALVSLGVGLQETDAVVIETLLGMETALGQLEGAAKTAGESIQEGLRATVDAALSVQAVVGAVVTGIVNGIVEAITFSREAAQMAAQDADFGARSAQLSYEQSVQARIDAQQRLTDALRSGNAQQVADARFAMRQATLAEERAQAARTKAATKAADTRATAEESAGKRVLRTIGQVLLDSIAQLLQAAGTQILVAGIVAAVEAIKAHAGIPFVGAALGIGAAALIGGIVAGFAAKLPKAQDGGVMMGGSTVGDRNMLLANRGEVVLSVTQQERHMGGRVPVSGTTGGGMGRIDETRLAQQMGRGGDTYNISVRVDGDMSNPRQKAEQLADALIPILRRRRAQGLF